MSSWNRKTLAEALSDKYTVDPNTGCWNWTACKGRTGYGKLGNYTDGKNKGYSAHRVSFMVHKGPIPPGMYILHTCDNRGCINPDHLYAGTQYDNMRDMVVRKRSRADKITHCPKGHPYSGPNLRLIGERKKACRACFEEYGKRCRLKYRLEKVRTHLSAETPKGVMCNRRNDKTTTALSEVTCKECLRSYQSNYPRRRHNKPEAA